MADEASNIVRRFLLVLFDLGHEQLGYVRKCARTLDPDDIRRLAHEVADLRPRQRGAAVAELRGIAKAIVRYGGPGAVLRDANPELVDALKKMAW